MSVSTRVSQAHRRKADILDAALTVFSAKGFHQATNREIAEAAGIASPGLIYHYFEGKQDLLVQLFERVNPLLRMVANPGAFPDMPLREGLMHFAARFLEIGAEGERLAIVRLFLGEALLDPQLADRLFEAGPLRGLSFLASWMDKHMAEGRLRRQPPLRLARQFVGPLLAALIFRVVFRREEAFSQELIESTVDTFLLGAATR